ncbi:MAG: type II toxin-antitoxin system antitoxin, RelB/DinJ family [Anaerobiospirillum sp.]|nr:type II toxin-antitoxin system antitoxin, RelB/DinJ family [Anaerobiospirillum sp.]
MATSTIQLTLPADEFCRINEVCAEHGLTFNDVSVRYAQQVVAHFGIPFELYADPFYSASNLRYLAQVKADLDAGRSHFSEHDLIEVD